MLDSINEVLVGLKIKATCVDSREYKNFVSCDIKLSPGEKIATLEKNIREIGLALKSTTPPLIKVASERGVVEMQIMRGKSEPLYYHEWLFGRVFDHGGMNYPFLLGKTYEGKNMFVDFTHNPHALIAGSTGSGKSVLLHTIVCCSIVFNYTGTHNSELYISDPKRVEFSIYRNNKVAENVIKKIVSSYSDTVEMMRDLVQQMEDRYSDMEHWGVRDTADYWGYYKKKLIVIDEVSDLLMQDSNKELRDLFLKIAQKGRAAGFFMVLATQRPSVDVLDGIIKANFPARFSCKTASVHDSRVIMDAEGAERLMGRGDCLIRNAQNDMTRFQVAFTQPEKVLEETEKFLQSRTLN